MRPFHVRTLSALALAIALASHLSAQQAGVVTVQVVDSLTSEPIQGAQVFIVGTQLGSLTNEEGRVLFASVPAGQRTVRVQYLGYGSRERTLTVNAGQTAVLDIPMQQQAIEMEGLVVTALGIEREERGLGYAVQSVGETALARSPEVTLVSALSGQAAGVSVVTASGRPGASARIVIRGETSFSGGGQPLFVVDGVPISIALDTRSVENNLLAPEQLDYGEAGSRMMDLDPNSIEDISILRGAAATALYGSRAAAGAIIIKTKRGLPGPTRFTFTSRTSFDRAILNDYLVTDWAAGLDGYYCNGKTPEQGGWCQPGYPSNNPSPLTTNNWGPHKDSIPQEVLDHEGEIRFADARKDFYDTGVTVDNSLNARGSVGGGFYNLGVSYVNQGGIVPASKLDRLNLSANVSLNLSDRLQTNTSVMYSNTQNDFQYEGWFGVARTLINLPPTRDVRKAWNDDGTPVLWGTNTPHPEWVVQNEYTGTLTNRWIASQAASFEIVPGLTVSNRIGLDTYVDERQRFQNERPWRTAENRTSGGTDQQKITRTQLNDDLTLSLATQPLSEQFQVSGLVGANVYTEEYSDLRAIGSDVNVPGFYNISNFATQRVQGTLTTQRRLVGIYSQATVDYSDWAFLTLTGRNDWSSTLPTNNNNYFYPSASLGIVFTDALGWAPSWLPYGKLRLSVAKVGNDAPPYRLSTRYSVANGIGADNGINQFNGPDLRFPFRGQNAYLQSSTLGNPDLKPESTREWEGGLELRLLQNRARVDFSYYHKSSYDQIFSVPSSASSGYVSITRNAGDLLNKGFELSLQGRPYQSRNLTWDIRANFSKNTSEVIRLAEGVRSLLLAGYDWPNVQIIEGHGYGVLWGYGWQRNCMEETSTVCFSNVPAGELLIGDNGLPILTNNFIALGDIQPDWLANFNTTFNYRGIGLSALFDVRQGGDILNFETNYLARSGRGGFTNDRGTYTSFEGVNVNTGQPNDMVVLKDRNFYSSVYGFDRHEEQVEDGSYVKLREVTVSYELPRSLSGQLGLQGLNLYLTGRNLKVWSDFSAGDPEGSNYGSGNAGGAAFRFFTLPQTRSFSLGLRAEF